MGLLKQQDVGPMSAQEYNSKCNGRTPPEKDVSQAFNVSTEICRLYTIVKTNVLSRKSPGK